jgi:hypothetical protein
VFFPRVFRTQAAIFGSRIEAMESALRLLRMVQIAMLVSIALYVFVGEEAAGRAAAPNPTMSYAISFVSITIVGVIFVVRRTLVLPSEIHLRAQPDDVVVLARWRSGYIFTYALCEALALFGLVLRMVGFTLAQVWPYYVGGFALMLLCWPRRPRVEAG